MLVKPWSMKISSPWHSHKLPFHPNHPKKTLRKNPHQLPHPKQNSKIKPQLISKPTGKNPRMPRKELRINRYNN
jgi:hypothetical protein